MKHNISNSKKQKYFKLNISCIMLHASCFMIFVSCFILLTSSVAAQNVNLTINPPLSRIIIKPEKTLTSTFELTNKSDSVFVTLSINQFKPDSPTGKIRFQSSYEPGIEFKLENTDISLHKTFFMESQQSKKINVNVTVTKSTLPGDYYYTLLAQTKNPSGREGETNSLVRLGIGTNILITVSNDAMLDLKGKISQFDVKPRFKINILGKQINFFDSFDTIPVILVISNNGNNLFNPVGNINLVGNFGERAAFPLLSQSVLATSDRIIMTQQENAPKSSNLSSLVLSGFYIGKYRLSTDVQLSDGTGTMYSATSFYAIPIKLTFAIILIIGILLIVIKQTKDS